MVIYPAIDLYDGKAVRLYKGDYAQMTVYNENPVEVALDFKACGATHIHLVDLEGAKSGTTPNLETVCAIKKTAGLFCEIGGGVRNMDVVERYLNAGVDRVILGTAAVTDEAFLRSAVEKYGDKIAVGIDIKDGFAAIRGWTEKSKENAMEFCAKMEKLGVRTIICTDISRDGAIRHEPPWRHHRQGLLHRGSQSPGSNRYKFLLKIFNPKLKIFIAPKVRQELYQTGFCDF